MESHSIKTLWKQQGPTLGYIKIAGSVGDYVVNLPDIGKAFSLDHGPVIAACIDGRQNKFPEARYIVRLAGMGCLVPDAKNAAEILKLAGTEEAYSHDNGCGAASMANKDAEEFARHMSGLAGIKYGVIFLLAARTQSLSLM